MRTKNEAWEFALKQLEEDSGDAKDRREKKGRGRIMTWHYGKCEIQELLNYIYGDKDVEHSDGLEDWR